jgi:hypothetical protein
VAARAASGPDPAAPGGDRAGQVPSAPVEPVPAGGAAPPSSGRTKRDAPIASPGRPITEQRWNTLHPKLIELFAARMGCPGAVEITDHGLIIYFGAHEPR